MSIMRPGVHTTISAPRFSSPICAATPLPPYTHPALQPETDAATPATPEVQQVVAFLVRYYGCFHETYYPAPEVTLDTILKNDLHLDGLLLAWDWFQLHIRDFPPLMDIILLPKHPLFYIPLYTYAGALIAEGRPKSAETEKRYIGITARIRATTNQMHAAEIIAKAAIAKYRARRYSYYVQ